MCKHLLLQDALAEEVRRRERGEEASATARVGEDIVKLRTSTSIENLDTLRKCVKRIDWNALASEYLPRFSGLECKIQWNACLAPWLVRTTWTTEENSRLTRAANTLGKFGRWKEISDQFFAGKRTAFDCLRQYVLSRRSKARDEWSREEDKHLLQAVSVLGEGDWINVCNVPGLQGRTPRQCAFRWQHNLNPAIRKGHFTAEEDARLWLAIKAYGGHDEQVTHSWSELMDHVPKRTSSQLSERWRQVLRPNIRQEEWTDEEDALLLKAIREVGIKAVNASSKNNWTAISKRVKGRTDRQCKIRWRQYAKKVIERQKEGTNESSVDKINSSETKAVPTPAVEIDREPSLSIAASTNDEMMPATTATTRPRYILSSTGVLTKTR